MSELPIIAEASAYETSRLETELAFQRSLARFLMERVVEAHVGSQYEQFGWASSTYDETLTKIRDIEEKLHPWQKDDYSVGETGEIPLLGLVVRQPEQVPEGTNISSPNGPRGSAGAHETGMSDLPDVNPLQISSIFPRIAS